MAVPLGLWAAVRTHYGRRRGTETAFTTLTGTAVAIPEYLYGLALLLTLSLGLSLLPPAGLTGPASFVLPVTALAIAPAAMIARLARVETLRELDTDYMRLAQAKRLPAWRLYVVHLLPNTLTATLTMGGLLLSGLITGSVLVENVFAWPGFGLRTVEAITQKDYPVAQAMILVHGALVLVVSFLVDILLGILDPKSSLSASTRRGAMRRLLRNPAGLLGTVIVALMVLLAIVAPLVWEEAATRMNPEAISQGASAAHPLGTDALGRDLLARTLVATRLTLGLAFLATLIGTVSGILLGTLPQILPRTAGRTVIAAVDQLVAFPAFLLALFTAVVAGLGAQGACLGIGVALAPTFARLTHTMTATVAGSDYIAAARMLRVPRNRILARHVLPNVAEPLILNTAQAMGSALPGLSAMSFLGMGVQAPSYDWGRLLNEAFGHVYVTPSVVIAPALAVSLAGLGFMLLGDTFAKAAAHSREASGRPVAPVVAPARDEPVPDAVLEVRDLTVAFPGDITPVRQVSLTVREGEIVGRVGESGSGKSMTAAAIGQIVPYPGLTGSARLRLGGVDLDGLTDAERRKLLGSSLAMVFQDPTSSLNPALRVGRQLAEVATLHGGATRPEPRARAVERLDRVRIKQPADVAKRYPHELSGGMRQRTVIAMGLMNTPRLIIVDEPTTVLDVTVQREVLRVLREAVDQTQAVRG